jgi:hypothetical protein
MILWTGKHPFAEARKRAGYRCDSDVAENFPAFHSLPAHLFPRLLKPLSDSGFIGCVFSTARNRVSSIKKLTQPAPIALLEVNLTANLTRVRDHGNVFSQAAQTNPEAATRQST